MTAFVFVAKADRREKKKPPKAAIDNTFCLPQVSAKKPQKYDVETIPRNDTDDKIPCCAIVNFKSHFAYGEI